MYGNDAPPMPEPEIPGLTDDESLSER